MLIGGIALGLMLAIVGSFVEVLQRGSTPISTVIAAPNVSQIETSHLVDSDILDSSETILLYFSTGLVSVEESGNLLTDDRVIHYVQTDKWKIVRSARYDDITGIAVLERGDKQRPSIIDISTADGRHLQVSLATAQQADERFIEEINRRTDDGSSDTIVEFRPGRP